MTRAAATIGAFGPADDTTVGPADDTTDDAALMRHTIALSTQMTRLFNLLSTLKCSGTGHHLKGRLDGPQARPSAGPT
jgi:hypothetical protein